MTDAAQVGAKPNRFIPATAAGHPTALAPGLYKDRDTGRAITVDADGTETRYDDEGRKVAVPTVDATGALTGNHNDLDMMHAPDPVGHFILVALPEVELRTESGVYIPETVTDRERAASVVGSVIAMGPDCYKDPLPTLPENLPNGANITLIAARPRFPSGPWCKIGDTVLFSRYAGKRFRIEGVEFRMLSDDEVTATVPAGAKVGGL